MVVDVLTWPYFVATAGKKPAAIPWFSLCRTEQIVGIVSGVGQTGGQCTGWHLTKYYLAVQVDMKDSCSWTETWESCCLTLLCTIQSGPRVSNIEVPYKCVYWGKVIQLDFDFRENLEESCCLVHMSVVQVYHIFMRTNHIADANTSLYYYIQVGQHNRNPIYSRRYR